MNSTPVSPQTLLNQLHWRYATKKFDVVKKIPADLWKALEQALVLSPSSYGLQPWKFTVITDPKVREQLKAVSWNQGQITEASHLVVFSGKKTLTPADVEHLIEATATTRHIPAATLDGYKQMMLGSVKSQIPEKLAIWNSRQVYIALGMFLSAAALLGVDACPMEGVTGPEYDKILGLDQQGFATLCVATAGYRAGDDHYAEGAKVRYPESEIMAHIH